jgi:hypothetical protein
LIGGMLSTLMKKLSQCHFVSHQSHMELRDIELGTLR